MGAKRVTLKESEVGLLGSRSEPPELLLSKQFTSAEAQSQERLCNDSCSCPALLSTKHFSPSYLTDHLETLGGNRGSTEIRSLAQDFADSREGAQASKLLHSPSLTLAYLESRRHHGGCRTHLWNHLVEAGHDVGAFRLLVIGKDPG